MKPFEQFFTWYAEAHHAEGNDADIMALATATPSGKPSVRMVLYRGHANEGIRFFTNQQSRKGDELRDNAHVAAVFHWRTLGRQLRIEGRVEPLTSAENEAYFASRPRGHQIAALVSAQSRPVVRTELEDAYHSLTEKLAGMPIPRPAHWGGYRILPDAFEFWQNGENRLHHRQRWEHLAGAWSAVELAP